MTVEEAIKTLKENICAQCAYGSDMENCDIRYCDNQDAIKALEQEPCEDKEYEKDLNELKEQILKEGNTLVAKQDLLERFVEIDNEYKHRPWNLLQILANMDILIGEEPCEDCVSRKGVHDMLENLPVTVESKWFNWLQMACNRLAELPPVTPERPKGEWIRVDNTKCKCSKCEVIHMIAQYPAGRIDWCPNCGADMRGVSE